MVEKIRTFGAADGAPGLQISEKIAPPRLQPVQYGTAAFIGGILKRGPAGIPFPVSSFGQYETQFGKPGDPTWHLFTDSAKNAFPDAIDGYFKESGGTGILWLLRNELDGTGKTAEQTFFARSNPEKPVLKIEASNFGRWGGYGRGNIITNVISFEEDQFIINEPDIDKDELKGGKVNFVNDNGTTSRTYVIDTNTRSESDGTVTCTIEIEGLGTVMEAEGFDPLKQVTGTINYLKHVDLTGTAAYSRFVDLSDGVAVISEESDPLSQTLIGRGTKWKTDLVGTNRWIYIAGASYYVRRIFSDTKIQVHRAVGLPVGEYTVQVRNYTVTGTGSFYTTELSVGDTVRWFFNDNQSYYKRKVRSITSDTEFTFYDSGNNGGLLPRDFTADTLSFLNRWVEGTGTSFGDDLVVGTILSGTFGTQTVRVEEIDTISIPERIRLNKPLTEDLVTYSLTTHPVTVSIATEPKVNNGLSIKIGNGQRYPKTHFSVNVFFEGQPVFSVADASLDPSDPLYIEESINNRNVGLEDDGVKTYTWIKATSLLTGSYKADEGNDVRPANAVGKIVHVDKTTGKVYYISGDDSHYVSGKVDCFFDMYENPRRSIPSVGNLTKVRTLVGESFQTSGTNVTGTNTSFLSDYEKGDFFYDPKSGEIREITNVASDTSLTLNFPFSLNVTESLVPQILGEIKLNSLSLDSLVVGKSFLMTFYTDLLGGTDGEMEALPPSYVTRYFDPVTNLLERSAMGKNHGLIRIATPGMTDPEIQAAAIEYASDRAYEYRVEIPPHVTDSISAEKYILEEVGRSDFISASFPSYGTIKDPITGGDRVIPLTGDIMGLESKRAASRSGYHGVAAGNLGRFSRITRLPFYLDPIHDEPLLTKVGLQPIVRKGGFILIWGARIPSASPKYSMVHVRRNQSHYIRMFSESPDLLAMLFRTDSPSWDQEIMLYLRSWAEGEVKKGAMEGNIVFGQAYVIERVSGENFDNARLGLDMYVSMAENTVSINIGYRPSRINEKVYISMNPEIVTGFE